MFAMACMYRLFHHSRVRRIVLTQLFVLLSACTGLAPVQEMSNARQTLQVAKAARADIFAQDQYNRAQDFLNQAANRLNSGDFSEARQLALQATHEAKQAHLAALSHQKR